MVQSDIVANNKKFTKASFITGTLRHHPHDLLILFLTFPQCAFKKNKMLVQI